MTNHEEERRGGKPDRRTCPHGDCNAADQAVKKTFAILGVDIDSPNQVRKFQEGISFGQALHKYTNKGIMAMVVVFSTAGAVALLYGIAMKIAHFSKTLPPAPK